MKKSNIYKGEIPYQSEFDHRFACWANNHRGWAKMKKFNKRLAKRRLKQKKNDLEDWLCASVASSKKRLSDSSTV